MGANTKKDLFIELAKPDDKGVSRWVNRNEFTGKYQGLQLGNGGSWLRENSALAKEYIIERDCSVTSGNRIDRIRLAGFNTSTSFSQQIRKDIVDYYKNKRCVMLGVSGNSENSIIEIDHKNGRKDDQRVSNLASQTLADFQPLCKAANTIKRQICKECKEKDLRWRATNILGNPFDFYEGDERYSKDLGCIGCYQYDPVEYRKFVVKKVSIMASSKAAETVFEILYPKNK